MTEANATTLAGEFERTFAMQLADTDALRSRVFQVRYQVFCQELGFAMQQSDGLEADAFDARSLHCLLQHRASGLDTGCVRLVLPESGIGGGLPFESFGLRYVDRSLFDWKRVDPMLCCEVSRLAVVSEFRRRVGEASHADGIGEAEDAGSGGRHRRFPFIAISLYHAVTSLILERPFEYVFMVIEPRLQRHLSRYGLNLRQISSEFDYYGQRATYVLTREQLQADVAAWRPQWQDLYATVAGQILHRQASTQRFSGLV